ncbi:PTS beta-glucoside transporter subunit IIABC [Clostridium perfringens]|nr:PTS beta-glucoside transporter subunit IIABC [Clostridium perfringens]
MKYEQLAKDIIYNVGEKENVNSVTHCITRLRFKLKDESKANTEVLKNMDGVVTVIKSGGQYQVVIGNHVPDVYKDVVEVGGFNNESSSDDNEVKEKTSLFNSFIDVISGVFSPILGLLAATGMIKGLTALFLALGWLSKTSGTYEILNAIGDSLFYFFPIFLGYTSAKKFKLNHFTGMVIGAALVYPALSGLTAGNPLFTLFQGTVIESPVYITFLGIPVILMTYSSSVIPIIIATYVASKVERGFKKIIPDVVKTFLVPFCTILVVIPLTFIVIGPIATWAGQILGSITLGIYNFSPLVAGLFIGGFWQVFVIFGLHWGLVPVAINNISMLGYDTILAMSFAASFAQIGVVLAIWIKTRDKKLKSLCIPAFISGLFGVTEPAIYGVTLPRKKPFILSCIASGVGGAIIGVMGTKQYIIGGLGIFGVPSFIDTSVGIDRAFYGALIAMVVAFVFGFLLVWLVGFKDENLNGGDKNKQDNKEVKQESLTNQEVIISPLKGEVTELSKVEDEAFSTGLLGKGIAIKPVEGKVVAPAGGVVTTFFPTGHALGITTDNGTEILIHVGMDTVQLEGKYFTPRVKQGDKIKAGDVLLEFDINKIKESGFSTITPVIITNSDKYLDIIETDKKDINYKEDLLTVVI